MPNFRPLVDTKTVLTTVDLNKCRTGPSVELYAAAPVSGYGHSDDKVSYSFDLPERDIRYRQGRPEAGHRYCVYLDGYELGQVDLVTHREYVGFPHRSQSHPAAALRPDFDFVRAGLCHPALRRQADHLTSAAVR